MKSSHHAIFDEAWYLHPQRPPFAQMLYDVGLEPELQEDDLCLDDAMPPPLYPPMPTKKPSALPLVVTQVPLPLRISTSPSTFVAAAARTVPLQLPVLSRSSSLPSDSPTATPSVDLPVDTPVQVIEPSP